MSDTPRTDIKRDETAHFSIHALRQNNFVAYEAVTKLLGEWVELCDQIERDLTAAARRERDMIAQETIGRVKASLQDDAVLGNGDYDQGLLCGVEDRGLQKDGYNAMRYGYDRALERVDEAIAGLSAEQIHAEWEKITAVCDAASEYKEQWLICHESNPREAVIGDLQRLGQIRGSLFAAIDAARGKK